MTPRNFLPPPHQCSIPAWYLKEASSHFLPLGLRWSCFLCPPLPWVACCSPTGHSLIHGQRLSLRDEGLLSLPSIPNIVRNPPPAKAPSFLYCISALWQWCFSCHCLLDKHFLWIRSQTGPSIAFPCAVIHLPVVLQSLLLHYKSPRALALFVLKLGRLRCISPDYPHPF